jgi:hypothetical protein
MTSHGSMLMTTHGSTCEEEQVVEEDEVVQKRAEDFLAFFCDQCDTENLLLFNQWLNLSGLVMPAGRSCYAPDMNPWILALNMHELMDCILPYPLTGSFDKTPGG